MVMLDPYLKLEYKVNFCQNCDKIKVTLEEITQATA
jgi:hypothetical protein